MQKFARTIELTADLPSRLAQTTETPTKRSPVINQYNIHIDGAIDASAGVGNDTGRMCVHLISLARVFVCVYALPYFPHPRRMYTLWSEYFAHLRQHS